MRRKDREITDFEAMRAIVDSCDCCRLGFVVEGEAYMVPLNFGYEVEQQPGQAPALVLYFHGAAAGKKWELLHGASTITFEMDTGHRLVPGMRADEYTFAYRSVMGRGTVALLDADTDKRHAMNRIMDHYTGRTGWEVSPAMLHTTAFFALRVTHWTAKAHLVP